MKLRTMSKNRLGHFVIVARQLAQIAALEARQT
jgi:hypothetical protein